MRVVTVPCRTDNFTYLVGADGTSDIAIVDPCDAAPVLAAVKTNALRVVAILNTHHHGDHVGGNRAVLDTFPGIPVYAHTSDQGRIPGLTHPLEDGDELSAAGLHFRVLFVPGHTNGHIAYVTDGAAFVGDTLFGGGCGRLFEGTPQMMNHSLNDKLARLPDATNVYFAHEYTASNLRFARSVEPNNAMLLKRIDDVALARSNGQWTTPSTIGLEKATNPFLRVDQAEIADHVGLGPGSPRDAVFAALRRTKDHF